MDAATEGPADDVQTVVSDTTPIEFVDDDATPIAKMLVSHNSRQWQWAWWEGEKGKRRRRTRYGGTYETLPQERKDEHKRNSTLYWERKIRAAARREHAEAGLFFE